MTANRGLELRAASAVNFASYVLAVVASLASFRVMIALTDTPTVGLWALVFGFATAIGVAEAGLGVNLTRYVASHGGVSRRLLARLAVVGAVLCLLPSAILALLAAWPIYRFAITRPDLPVPAGDVALFTALALGAMMVISANSIFSGLAEGLGRLAQRSVAILLYNGVALAALWPAIAQFGPVGIGVAQIVGLAAQLAMILTILFLAARKLPRTADEASVVALLRELYGSTMQNLGMVLARMALGPVARFYLALVGSLSVQAWFELALRVTNQLRSLVSASLQPLLYFGASDQQGMARRFEKPRAFTMRVSALLCLGLACTSPLISAAVLGRVEPAFIVFVLIMGLGAAIYIGGLPGYFAMLARGEFGTLQKIYLLVAVLNALLGGLGVLLGGGPTLVVAALSTAHAVTGIALVRYYARVTGKSPWSHVDRLWPAGLAAIVVGGALAVAASRFAPTTVLALAAASCLLLLAPAWSLGRMFLQRGAGPEAARMDSA